MTQLPSRHRRLDDALADLPLEEPMLLSELDGYLTGIALGPEAVPQEEWMTLVWGPDDGDVPPFEHPEDVAWFVQAVAARRDEIARELARGKPKPILEVDERNGELLWEIWIEGFAEAMALRPEAWQALAEREADAANALSTLTTLIAVARNDSALDSIAINALQDEAPAMLVEGVLQLCRARHRAGLAAAPPAIAAVPAKVGRNDPCPCGSGRKSKRCCG